MKIAISAGHYPAAPGAAYGTMVEHPEAVIWIDRIAAVLRHLGADVFVTKPAGLSGKISSINRFGPVLAMELHFNSDPKHAGMGSETLYAPGSIRGMRLAGMVQAALADLCPPSRGIKEGWYRMAVGGIVDAFLKLTHCPAVIVQPLFIHPGTEIIAARETAPPAIARALFDVAQEFSKGD